MLSVNSVRIQSIFLHGGFTQAFEIVAMGIVMYGVGLQIHSNLSNINPAVPQFA
ncbi:hypothetical protein A2U01_0029412 [Trifolium medium]|uniref:Uncharacterized protein n=1 Tax=Trifolium medium TaxID=97028 RepID=A0A392PAN3_9FABA|nr:hypothetical protein [Trifolium medium]